MFFSVELGPSLCCVSLLNPMSIVPKCFKPRSDADIAVANAIGLGFLIASYKLNKTQISKS